MQNASFNAIIDGSSWVANNNIKVKCYKEYLWIYGENEDYSLSIQVYRLKKGSQSAICDLWNKKNNIRYSTDFIDPKLNVTEINQYEGYITATFEITFNIDSNQEVNSKRVVVNNGIMNRLKFTPLFCQKDYEIKTGNYDIFGMWNLVQISDILIDTVYYPLCDYDVELTFGDAKVIPDNVLIYEYSLAAFGGCNTLSSSYSFLNDSIMVSSGGIMQLKSCEPYIDDFETLFFNSLSKDTFLVIKENNVLKLTGYKGKEMIFYK